MIVCVKLVAMTTVACGPVFAQAAGKLRSLMRDLSGEGAAALEARQALNSVEWTDERMDFALSCLWSRQDGWDIAAASAFLRVESVQRTSVYGLAPWSGVLREIVSGKVGQFHLEDESARYLAYAGVVLLGQHDTEVEGIVHSCLKGDRACKLTILRAITERPDMATWWRIPMWLLRDQEVAVRTEALRSLETRAINHGLIEGDAVVDSNIRSLLSSSDGREVARGLDLAVVFAEVLSVATCQRLVELLRADDSVVPLRAAVALSGVTEDRSVGDKLWSAWQAEADEGRAEVYLNGLYSHPPHGIESAIDIAKTVGGWRMRQLQRLVVVWFGKGVIEAPAAVLVLAGGDVEDEPTRLCRALFSALRGRMPANAEWVPDNSGDAINVAVRIGRSGIDVSRTGADDLTLLIDFGVAGGLFEREVVRQILAKAPGDLRRLIGDAVVTIVNRCLDMDRWTRRWLLELLRLS